jgi:hypothetical protein
MVPLEPEGVIVLSVSITGQLGVNGMADGTVKLGMHAIGPWHIFARFHPGRMGHILCELTIDS